jgi:Acetyltransferase (GNAT) domain
MPIILARFFRDSFVSSEDFLKQDYLLQGRAMLRFSIEKVTPESSTEIKKRLYRLRHEIYCHELKMPLATKNGLLNDQYDDYSTNFLLVANDIDIGTIRWTANTKGPLELETQSQIWQKLLHDSATNRNGRIFEINRFMIKRQFRKTAASIYLVDALRSDATSKGYNLGFFAGREGSLSLHYRRFGGKITDATPATYRVDGFELGYYHLMKLDYGEPLSFTRLSMAMRYKMMSFFAPSIWKPIRNLESGHTYAT